jgi:Spy/CpxP family protein refolding chaperone
MKRETLLTLAVAALLLLNLGMVAYLLMSRRPPEEREEMPQRGKRIDELIITRLHLSEAQQEQFKALKHQHRSAMDSLDREYRGVVEQYFRNLPKTSVDAGTSMDAARRDSLQRLLEHLHGQKISTTLRHFTEISSICLPEQRPMFEQLLPELSRMMLQPPRKPREGAPNGAPGK